MAEGIENAPAEVGKGLGHKLGPLPVWGWIAVVAAGAGVYFLVIAPNAAQNQSNALNALPLSPGALPGGPGGPGGPTTSPPPTTPTIPDNTTWLQKAVQAATTGFGNGVTPAEAQLYLQEYLSGTTPVGNSQATGRFNSIIQYVLGVLGNPPVTPINTGLNTNPYASNQNWLTSVLAFLPQGTPASVANELTAWINGTTKTLSQATVNALIQAEGIVGLMPTPLTYTIQNQPGGPTKSAFNFNNFTGSLSYLQANVIPGILGGANLGNLIAAFDRNFSTQNFNLSPQNLITIAYLRQSFINTFSQPQQLNQAFLQNEWQTWVQQANLIFQQKQ